MTRKIFQSIIGVAVAVLLGSVLIVMGVLYSYFEEESMDQLRNEAAYAASGIETMGVEYLDGISKQDDSVRITLVAADGSVTYDSLMDERSMENHGEREEIKAAVEMEKAAVRGIRIPSMRRRSITLCAFPTAAYFAYPEHRSPSGFSFRACRR